MRSDRVGGFLNGLLLLSVVAFVLVAAHVGALCTGLNSRALADAIPPAGIEQTALPSTNMRPYFRGQRVMLRDTGVLGTVVGLEGLDLYVVHYPDKHGVIQETQMIAEELQPMPVAGRE